MRRRLFSIVPVLALCLGLLPGTALAADEDAAANGLPGLMPAAVAETASREGNSVTIDVRENTWISCGEQEDGKWEYQILDTTSISFTKIDSGSLSNTNLTITGEATNVNISIAGIPAGSSVTLKDLHIDNSDGDTPLYFAGVSGTPPEIAIGIEGKVELIGSHCAIATEDANATLRGSGNLTAAAKTHCTIQTRGSFTVDVEGDVSIRMEDNDIRGVLFFNTRSDNSSPDPVKIKGKNVTLAKAGGAPAYENGTETAGVTVTAAEKLLNVPVITLDFSSASPPSGTLDTDGYHWDASTNTLSLKNAKIGGTVTLPDGPVTIRIAGDCFIDTLAVNGSLNSMLTFTGEANSTTRALEENTLTVQKRIDISGGDGNALTVEKNTRVIAKGGICIGASGGVNSTVTVNGELVAAGENTAAISAGKVGVGDTGELNVKGRYGVQLNGMSGNPRFESAFTVEGDGRFTANCSVYNIRASTTDANEFPKDADGKIDASKVINVPQRYLPENCEVKATEDGKHIDLWNTDTQAPYTGLLAIHDKHDYIGATWEHNNTHHWKECTYEGCEKKDPDSYGEHSFSWIKAGDTYKQKCGKCEYETVGHTEHTLKTEYSYNADGHWQECVSDCGYTTAPDAHIYEGTKCKVCDYSRAPEGGGSGGGGEDSGDTYQITVEPSPHGTVTVNRAYDFEGSTVTLTVTPDPGYALETLTVTDSRGNECKLTELDGKYQFTMPGRTVTVKAVFAALPDENACDGGIGCPSRAFTDLDPSEWYHEAVDYVLRNGLMSGVGGGLFDPEGGLSRAQFAQILHNQAGSPIVSYPLQFTDVPDGAWYTEAVRWAASQGIVSGYGNGKFGPDDPITREQLAVMLWRYGGSPGPAGKELDFVDTDKISGYALEGVRWAVENGILSGHGDGRLDPDGLATRVQAAQMIKKFLEALA